MALLAYLTAIQPKPKQNTRLRTSDYTTIKGEVIMQVTQKDKHHGRSGGNMSTSGGFAMNNHNNEGKSVSMRRWSKRASSVLLAATAAAIMFFSAAPFAAGQ